MLRPAPPMSAGDAALMRSLARSGLHPYRKHVGVRYLPGCTECFGRRCARGCKMDGRSAGVEPALATGTAAVIDRCEVRALRGSSQQVTHVEAVRGGEILQLRAKHFVVAAGTLGSPRLLLASASAHWPNGCANRSGLVGRNLMFKLLERIAIWPERHSGASGPRAPSNGPCTSISLRDFYQRDGIRFGHVQSVGLDASYGLVVQHLKEWFDRSAGPGCGPCADWCGCRRSSRRGCSATPRSSRGFSRIFPTRRIASFSIRRTRVGSASSTACRTSCSHGARRSARCSAVFGAGSGRSSCTPNPS